MTRVWIVSACALLVLELAAILTLLHFGLQAGVEPPPPSEWQTECADTILTSESSDVCQVRSI
jgi:hypothetical protein